MNGCKHYTYYLLLPLLVARRSGDQQGLSDQQGLKTINEWVVKHC